MFKEIFTEASKSRGMSTSKFNKIMKMYANVQKDFEADGMDFTDDVAFEIAATAMSDNPGLEAYIKNFIGASDHVGWFANQI